MIKVLGHRGCAGLEPENTIRAFKKAVNLKVDLIEFDVRMTKDKELVVIHDEKVDRETNGKGYVKDFEGICIPKKIDEGPKFPKDKNGDVIISQPNFGQPVGGGSGGGGGGSEETPTQPVKKNYFWLYILGAGILYMVLKKKSN